MRLLTVAKGEIGELHIGFKGTMNALFLRDLKAKIKRGQRGRAGDGLTPGGLSYGYEVVREFDDKGELLRGCRRVIEAEAVIIRRIFEEFAAGRSARSIAAGHRLSLRFFHITPLATHSGCFVVIPRFAPMSQPASSMGGRGSVMTRGMSNFLIDDGLEIFSRLPIIRRMARA